MTSKFKQQKGAAKSVARKTRRGDVLTPYINKWVALSGDHARVLASGKTLAEVNAQFGAKERKEVVFHLVPDKPLAMYMYEI